MTLTAADPGGGDFGESITSYNTDDIGTVGGIFVRGIQSNTMILCAPGNRGASLLSRRAHLLTTPKGRWYCLRQLCALRGGCGFCGSLMDNVTSRRCCCHCPRRRLYILLHQQNSCFRFGNNLPSASEKHQPDVFHCYGYRFFCDTHFLFAKKKQKS